MNAFDAEISAFRMKAAAAAEEARIRAALQLACGIDLDAAMTSPPAERRRIAAGLHRRVERERLKGLARHWSYDLNRHIALKRAAERLAGKQEARAAGEPPA